MPLLRVNGKLVLFVHVPKTGGTTVENWLSDLGAMALIYSGVPDGFRVPPQHMTAAQLRDCGLEGFADHTYCITRDPLDRLVSEFFWAHRRRLSETGTVFPKRKPWQRDPSLGDYFHEWVSTQLETAREKPHHRGNHMVPQSAFLGLEGCRQFRLEDGMGYIMAEIAKDLGLEQPAVPERANKADRMDLDILPKTRRLIDQVYGEDFERLGYPRMSDRG